MKSLVLLDFIAAIVAAFVVSLHTTWARVAVRMAGS
jgi:hypothetical protein